MSSQTKKLKTKRMNQKNKLPDLNNKFRWKIKLTTKI